MDEEQYQAKTWVDNEQEGTPITYSDLNRMDKGIEQIHKVLSYKSYVIQEHDTKPGLGVFLDVYGKVGVLRYNLSGTFKGSTSYVTVGHIPDGLKLAYDLSRFGGQYCALSTNNGHGTGYVNAETGIISYRVINDVIFVVGSMTLLFE